MLFKPGDRVRYDGQDIDKLGLKFNMEGKVVRCFRDSVDVHFSDLQRVVHLMDFHMRTSLKRIPVTAQAKQEGKRNRSPLIQAFGLIAAVVLVAAIIIFIITFNR